MVFGFGNDNNESQYDRMYNQPHQAQFSHEALGGAAAFFAMREYEKHQAANGHPPSHAFAKELMAGIAAAEVDKLIETKGMDYMDREKAKRHARQQAEQMYDQQYGGRDISSSGNNNWGYLGNQYGVGSGMGGGYGMQQGGGGYGGQQGVYGQGGYGGQQGGYGAGRYEGGGGYGGPPRGYQDPMQQGMQGGYGGPPGGYGGQQGGYGGPPGGFGAPQGGYGQPGVDEGHHHHHHNQQQGYGGGDY